MKGFQIKTRLCRRRAVSAVAGVVAFAALSVAGLPTAEAKTARAAEQVSYPVKTFQNGTARYYSHKADHGVVIKYFILKSSDGVIRAAFDACDVCFEAGKGYEQKGDFMVCRQCGRRFVSNRINEVQGGCNPAPLKRVVRGDEVVIEVKDILEGRRYFTFGKGGRK